jgi:hypothetical protein
VNIPDGLPSSLNSNGKIINGSTLMRTGLDIPCRNQFDSSIIELIAETNDAATK